MRVFEPIELKKIKKSDIIDMIKAEVSKVECDIVKIYGVSCGVGYDLDIDVYFKIDLKQYRGPLKIKAHAGPRTWCMPGHLRPNNRYYEYKGRSDRYQEVVRKYWQEPKKYDGLAGYLDYMTKKDIMILYHSLSRDMKIYNLPAGI
jgi:hypothetical protein